jgi:hypothetical protein
MIRAIVQSKCIKNPLYIFNSPRPVETGATVSINRWGAAWANSPSGNLPGASVATTLAIITSKTEGSTGKGSKTLGRKLLKERGLILPEEKTKITHIEAGFDFRVFVIACG